MAKVLMQVSINKKGSKKAQMPLPIEERDARFGKLLVDSRSVQLQLVEGSEEAGKVMVRGEFARVGIATENKRVYPRKLIEREFGRLESALGNRQVFGELDHPTDGRTSLNRTSHIITNLQVTDEGVVIGEAEVLDTERGKNLAALLKAGCKVGVSSRGYGSTKTNEQGEEVVQDDYRLVTYDFVAEPADTRALPDVFFEETGHMGETADVESKIKAALADQQNRLKEEFARELLSAIGKAKTELREQVRGEMLSDPAVAAAKGVLDQMKDLLRPYVLPEDTETVVKSKDTEISRLKAQIAERDLKLKEMEETSQKLAEAAKEAGYGLFLQKHLSEEPDAKLIMKLVGDVKKYATSDEIKVKVESIKADLAKKAEEQKRADAEKEKLLQKVQAEAKQAAEKAAKYEEALEKSLQAQKATALQLYAERKLVNHPKASRIRTMIESANPENREDIDSIIEGFREPARDTDDLDAVRARVRKVTGGGSGSTALDEETPSPGRKGGRSSDYNGLGMSLPELKKLAGINNNNR